MMMEISTRCPDCGSGLSLLKKAIVSKAIDGFVRPIKIRKYWCYKCRLRVVFRILARGVIIISAYLLDEEYYSEFTVGESIR